MPIDPLDLVKGLPYPTDQDYDPLIKANVLDGGDMAKAKYTRRVPKPGGGYRYYYDDPGQGPQQGGAMGSATRRRQGSKPVTLPKASLLSMLSRSKGGMTEGEMLWQMNHPDSPENFKHLRDQLGALIAQGDVRRRTKDGQPHYFAKAAETVSDEIRHLMRNKNYPQDRAVAAALEMERRGKIKKTDGEDESEEEDEDEDEETDEEDVQKARIDPLDLVKHELPAPDSFRIGSVTYHVQGAHELHSEPSRRSMRKAEQPAPLTIHEDPLDLAKGITRMGGGRLVAPNGRGGDR